MDKKSFRPRLLNFLTLSFFCLLLGAPASGQPAATAGKSLADLFQDFKDGKKLACGKRAETLRVGRELVATYRDDHFNLAVVDWVKKQLATLEAEEKRCLDEEALKAREYSLPSLYDKFRLALKAPCGERGEAVDFGKMLINLHGADEKNQEIIRMVDRRLPVIAEQDRVCLRNARFDAGYKNKKWSELFTVGRQIVTEESNKPLVLDVMLTLAMVGYELTANEKNETYDTDTVYYAKRAIDLIESGISTQSCWGVFDCHKTKDKALGWLNYTIGYISYFRFRENKKAIPYFYKATQYNMEFKYDAFMYQAVAIHYFENQAIIVSGLVVSDFLNRANGLTNDLVGFTKTESRDAAKDNEIATLYKNLINLYRLRYNLAPDENVNSLADYIQKLISRPLLDPAANVKRKPAAVR